MSLDYFRSLLFRSLRIRERIDHERRQTKPDSMRLLKLQALRIAIKERLAQLVFDRRREMMTRQALRLRRPQPSQA